MVDDFDDLYGLPVKLGVVSVLEGGQCAPVMRWGDHPLESPAVVGGAVAIPGCDALNGASVKVCECLRGQAEFLQPPEVEEVLLRCLHHTVCVGGPFQIASAKELEAFQLLNCGPIDVDGGMLPLLSPEVHDQLLHFVDGEAPLCQGLHLLPVGCLVIVGNKAYYCCVVCKLDDRVGVVRGHPVMGEQGVQEGTEHTRI